MVSLRELAEQLEPGHYLAWQTEDGKPADRTWSKTVETVENRGETIRIEAKGERGGKYHFTIDGSGNSEAFYHDPSQKSPTRLGSVTFAELRTTNNLVPIKRGFYDNRGESGHGQ